MPLHRAVLAGLSLVLSCSCSEAPREQQPPRRQGGASSAAAPLAPKPAPVVRSRPARPAPEPVAETIDPALVPVEEDFRAEVEQRIGRRTDLDREIQRVARELAKRQ